LNAADNEEIGGHFIGSIVYIESGLYHVSAVPKLLVIDGQQRLTTLSLLMIAIRILFQIKTKRFARTGWGNEN
jgi:uncharacterized protein with ParB-like and HNH nuclease domain